MLGRRDSADAEQLDRCLSGGAVPEGPDMRAMVMAAAALAPRHPISPTARQRAFDAMMREADRVSTPVHTEAADDLTDPGVHARVAQAGPGLRLGVADIEEVDDARLEAIAANIAARLGQRSPDRNQ